MIKQVLSLLLIFPFLPLWGQNLIPNGDFSQHYNTSCALPFEGMFRLPDWYSVGQATVDFYDVNCSHNAPSAVLNNPFFHYANSANGFIGFWGLFKTNFTITSEAFGTPLKEALRSDLGYWFSVDIRSRGKGHPMPGVTPLYCPTDPKMEFHVYTSENEISADFDGENEITQIYADKVLTLDIIPIVDTVVSEKWVNFQRCLPLASRGRHIGFSMTVDSFAAAAPCDAPYNPIAMNKWYGYLYFNVDNFQLLPFPLQVKDTILLCKERRSVTLDASDYFNGIPLSELSPIWEDGQTSTLRTYTTGGWYQHRLQHCEHTDFQIFVDEKSCEAKPYIPNAFSPNFDGINDEFHPLIAADFPIANYKFTIFDRWGNHIYESNKYEDNRGWNGLFRGKKAQDGVYVWLLRFDLELPDKKISYQQEGNVLLIR